MTYTAASHQGLTEIVFSSLSGSSHVVHHCSLGLWFGSLTYTVSIRSSSRGCDARLMEVIKVIYNPLHLIAVICAKISA